MTTTSPLLLIVDDSRVARSLLRAQFGDLRPAWRMAEAASGDESLAIVLAASPNYVSMDVNMPGMNGLEAAGRIRLHHPQIRIALCTANIQEGTRASSEKAGIHFAAKPITAKSVADMVAYFERAA